GTFRQCAKGQFGVPRVGFSRIMKGRVTRRHAVDVDAGSPVRERRNSVPEGAGPGLRPAAGHLTTAVRPAPRRHITSAVKEVVIMPKPRPTLPIAHADDLPRIAFTDEEWQAIQRAYPRQLNADVRQQITTVTTQYLKECVFERTAVLKAMARERIERIMFSDEALAKAIQ